MSLKKKHKVGWGGNRKWVWEGLMEGGYDQNTLYESLIELIKYILKFILYINLKYINNSY